MRLAKLCILVHAVQLFCKLVYNSDNTKQIFKGMGAYAIVLGGYTDSVGGCLCWGSKKGGGVLTQGLDTYTAIFQLSNREFFTR